MTPVMATKSSKAPAQTRPPTEAAADLKPTAPESTSDVPAGESDDREALRADAMRRRLSPTGSMDDTYLRELLGSSLPEGAPSPRGFVRRTKSCGVHVRGKSYRVLLGYHDEKLRERCERNTQQLLQTAFDAASAESTSAILARKALRYRKILQRMEDSNVDVNDPSFDASECLGVRWHRVASE